MDVFNSIGNYAGKAGNWVAQNKNTIGSVVDSAGKIVKTGIQVGKEVEDLKRVQALRKATEEALRNAAVASAEPKVDMSIIKPPTKSDIFKNLRLLKYQYSYIPRIPAILFGIKEDT